MSSTIKMQVQIDKLNKLVEVQGKMIDAMHSALTSLGNWVELLSEEVVKVPDLRESVRKSQNDIKKSQEDIRVLEAEVDVLLEDR